MEQDKPELVSMEATYRQEEDSNAPSNSLGQFITIKAEDAGGGFFYVISTERWAVNDPKELFELLESFRRMVELPTNTTEG